MYLDGANAVWLHFLQWWPCPRDNTCLPSILNVSSSVCFIGHHEASWGDKISLLSPGWQISKPYDRQPVLISPSEASRQNPSWGQQAQNPLDRIRVQPVERLQTSRHGHTQLHTPQESCHHNILAPKEGTTKGNIQHLSEHASNY